VASVGHPQETRQLRIRPFICSVNVFVTGYRNNIFLNIDTADGKKPNSNSKKKRNYKHGTASEYIIININNID